MSSFVICTSHQI